MTTENPVSLTLQSLSLTPAPCSQTRGPRHYCRPDAEAMHWAQPRRGAQLPSFVIDDRDEYRGEVPKQCASTGLGTTKARWK